MAAGIYKFRGVVVAPFHVCLHSHNTKNLHFDLPSPHIGTAYQLRCLLRNSRVFNICRGRPGAGTEGFILGLSLVKALAKHQRQTLIQTQTPYQNLLKRDKTWQQANYKFRAIYTTAVRELAITAIGRVVFYGMTTSKLLTCLPFASTIRWRPCLLSLPFFRKY